MKYKDKKGLAACVVSFPKYPVATPVGKLNYIGGHDGVLTYNDTTGKTDYYEYGRYSPNEVNIIGFKKADNSGNVKKVKVPNVKIDPLTGKPSTQSWDKLKEKLKKIGKDNDPVLNCKDDADEDKVKKYAEDIANNQKREDYSIISNNCWDFAADSVEAGLPSWLDGIFGGK